MKNPIAKLLLLSLALVVAGLTVAPARADAPLISITGTVVSRDGDVLTVRTDKGDLRFDIDKDTEMPADLPVGSQILVWYDSDDKPEDKMDARRIEMAPAPDVKAATPPPATPYTPTTQTQSYTQTETSHEELPRTASPLPLVGGTGLLTLLGGSALLLKNKLRRK